MRIDLRIGEDLVAGELYDNPVADQIAALLPFEAGFDDFHDQEKLAPLGRSLDLAGVPSADAPSPGEISYYASGARLVLFYASPGRWPGLVRVGRFDFPLDALRALPDGTRIRIAAAETAERQGAPRKRASRGSPSGAGPRIAWKASRREEDASS